MDGGAVATLVSGALPEGAFRVWQGGICLSERRENTGLSRVSGVTPYAVVTAVL